jgi:hypothetical protein
MRRLPPLPKSYSKTERYDFHDALAVIANPATKRHIRAFKYSELFCAMHFAVPAQKDNATESYEKYVVPVYATPPQGLSGPREALDLGSAHIVWRSKPRDDEAQSLPCSANTIFRGFDLMGALAITDWLRPWQCIRSGWSP